MPKGKKRLRDCLGRRLSKQLESLAVNAEATCQEFQKGDNIQGAEHCKAVEKNLDLLIPDVKKESSLSETEIFVLLAAAHLHDIGKVEGSNRSGWKSEHGHRAQEIINENYDKLRLDRVQAVAVGYVAGVHGDGRLDQLPPKPMLIGTDEVHLIELAAVFRLGDMLDTTYQRAPELVARILFPDGNVPDKWQARQTISGWTLDERNRIVLQAIPATDEVRVAYALKDMMNEDLAKIAPHLRLAGYPWELAELDVGAVRLTPTLRQKSDRDRPFPGMAYYEEDQANIFRGREDETEKLVSVVSNSPIALLIGESGAGKTSLIHAGLFPRLRAMMWECVWTRPLGNPRAAVRDLIWRAILEGPVKGECGLWEVMKLAAEKCRPRNLLIVMDQFEDVLSSPQPVLDELAKDFVTVQARYVMPNLRVLVAFREDSLVRLSTRLLKGITGSAQQFPSVELERLTRDGAKQAFLAGLENARIGLDPRQDVGQEPLIEIILNDIQQADDRLYPPYLQMVAETLCSVVDKDNPIISREKYRGTGGANNIIAHYLIRRLDELGPQREQACKVLVFLTSSVGRKAQKTLAALCQATGIRADELKAILDRMIDLRMARAIDNEEYEIIHDHLGRLVDTELVGKEDRELKFLQEQLDAAQRLYEVHREPIRSPTVWASLYRNRRRIVVGQDKQSLLLCSFLWNVAESEPYRRKRAYAPRTFRNGNELRCGWFWLRGFPHTDLLRLLVSLIRHEEYRIRKPAADLLISLATQDDMNFVADLLKDEDRDVRWAAVEIFAKLGTYADLNLIGRMLGDKDEVVRQAVVEAFAELGSHADLNLIAGMLKDEDYDVRKAAVEVFARLGTHDDLNLIAGMFRHEDEDEDVREAAVKAFAKLSTREDLSLVAGMLKDNDYRVRQAAVEAFAKLGTHDDLNLIASMLNDEDEDVRQAAVEAFAKLGTHDDLSLIAGMLKDEDWDARRIAVEVLTKLGTHGDLNLIADMIKEEDYDVREAAAEAFAKFVTRDDLNMIAGMLKEEDYEVREAAAEAFAKVSTHDDLNLIAGMLKDNHDQVRRAALEAFARVSTHDDLDRIAGMLNDESYAVRRAAVKAFAELNAHDNLSLIAGMLTDRDEEVRQAAVEGVVQAATVADGEGLLDAMAERSQGWDSVARAHYEALCLLDRKFYCPIPPIELTNDD